MEKRAALFTEKGVIPFGLEALVDRPAFIHHNPPPLSPPPFVPTTNETANSWNVEKNAGWKTVAAKSFQR